MPIKDNKSNTEIRVLYQASITGNGATNTPSIDGADFDNGLTFFPLVSPSAGVGATTIDVTSIEDSPDDSVWSTVSTDNIIGDLTDLTLTASGGTQSGALLKAVGVIGTQRYVRVVVTVTNFDDQVQYFIAANAGVEVAPGDS